MVYLVLLYVLITVLKENICHNIHFAYLITAFILEKCCVHEKETTNNIILNKVQTTGKSKLSYDEQKKQSFISVLQNSVCLQPLFCSSNYFS